MWKKLRKSLEFPDSYVSITLGFLVVIVAGILAYNYFSKNKINLTPTLDEESRKEKLQQDQILELPQTYKVVTGDNLWKIAEKFYTSGYNWVTIAQANNISNPDYIGEGTELNIPKAEIIRPESENIIAGATVKEKEYTVVRGDNLWNIAVRELGDGYAWTKIASNNNLANPNIIHAGNVLKLSM